MGKGLCEGSPRGEKSEAESLRVKRNQRVDRSPCLHRCAVPPLPLKESPLPCLFHRRPRNVVWNDSTASKPTRYHSARTSETPDVSITICRPAFLLPEAVSFIIRTRESIPRVSD